MVGEGGREGGREAEVGGKVEEDDSMKVGVGVGEVGGAGGCMKRVNYYLDVKGLHT